MLSSKKVFSVFFFALLLFFGAAQRACAATAFTYIDVRCENPSMEAMFRRIATYYLRQLRSVEISDHIESANAVVSFHEIKVSRADGEKPGFVVYSFGYGLVEVDIDGGYLIASPRYLDHVPVISPRNDIDRHIRENIILARDNIF